MKNAINYFYNIVIDDIHQTDKMFYFDYGGYRYAMVLYQGDAAMLKDIYNLHLVALKNGLYVHQIILNKDHQIGTIIGDKVYVLMRVIYNEGNINLESLWPFMSVVITENESMVRADWETLWSNKIDYLEYEIGQLGEKYPEIRDTFSYFIGLGETSIQLTNVILNGKKQNILKTLAHHRINYKDEFFDLYNPLNLVIDYRVRDAASYFKSKYFAGENIDEELRDFLKYANLIEVESLLFLARMLYPSYYFDAYEAVISGKEDASVLKKITTYIDGYQELLKRIYFYYKDLFPIPQIEWLER